MGLQVVDSVVEAGDIPMGCHGPKKLQVCGSEQQELAIVAKLAAAIVTWLGSQTVGRLERNDADEFSAKVVPVISIEDYMKRLVKYCNQACGMGRAEDGKFSSGIRNAVGALYYLEKLNSKCDWFAINEYNIHRLLQVSFYLSIKFQEDHPVSIDFWSRVAGIKRDEALRLEIAFCKILNFEMYIDPVRFNEILNFLYHAP